MTRKICIVVNSRANYGRIKSVIREVLRHPETELQLIVGASALLDRFGNVASILENDGLEISAKDSKQIWKLFLDARGLQYNGSSGGLDNNSSRSISMHPIFMI